MQEGIKSGPLLFVFVRDGIWAFMWVEDSAVLYKFTESTWVAVLWAVLALEHPDNTALT